MSDSLWPHESQHSRPPCPAATPGVYSSPCPLSQWCHPAISSSVVPFSSCPQSLPTSGSFPMSQLFTSGGPEYWSFSFSISPSNEHPGLISFRMDWLKFLAVQGTLKSLLQHHRSKASILRCSAFFIVLLKMIVTGLLWWLSGKRSIFGPFGDVGLINVGDVGLIPDLGGSWMPRRCGFDPWSGRILNAKEQRSP